MKSLDEKVQKVLEVKKWLYCHMTRSTLVSMEANDLIQLEAILSHWQKMAVHEIRERAKQ